MKIAVIGGSGYIAQYLKRFLKKKDSDIELLSIGRSREDILRLDLSKPEEFDYQKLNHVDYVIFAAAISSPDLCETNYEFAYKVNVTGTSYFIKRALDIGCKIVFLSSDSVYGFLNTEINEKTETVAETAYGKMKKEIEDEFRKNENFKSIRLSYVFSSTDKFSKYLKECREKKETAEVFDGFSRSCVTISEVLNAIWYLINNWNSFSHPFLNICGDELVSRVDIAENWKKIYHQDFSYHIVSAPKDFFKTRPMVLKMSSLYIDKIIPNLNCSFYKRMKLEIESTEEE